VRSALAAIALTTVLTAGCGGASSSPAPVAGATGATGASGASGATGPAGPRTPRAAVTRTVQTVLGPGDPRAVCLRLTTARYVAASYGDTGGCISALVSQPTTTVAVKSVQIGGDRATAVAVPKSGPNGGEQVHVTLVQEGGTWKVDSVNANVQPGP
jgi:hypothetical protein